MEVVSRRCGNVNWAMGREWGIGNRVSVLTGWTVGSRQLGSQRRSSGVDVGGGFFYGSDAAVGLIGCGGEDVGVESSINVAIGLRG